MAYISLVFESNKNTAGKIKQTRLYVISLKILSTM